MVAVLLTAYAWQNKTRRTRTEYESVPVVALNPKLHEPEHIVDEPELVAQATYISSVQETPRANFPTSYSFNPPSENSLPSPEPEQQDTYTEDVEFAEPTAPFNEQAIENVDQQETDSQSCDTNDLGFAEFDFNRYHNLTPKVGELAYFQNRHFVPLTLIQADQAALCNNLAIKIESFNPIIESAAILEAKG